MSTDKVMEQSNEAEIERLAREAAEAQDEQDMQDRLVEEHERECREEEEWLDRAFEEFGQLEILREEHFSNLRQYDREVEKRTVRYPWHEYMVDDLLPLNELHIIAGESGAGKSTWLFQMIDDWQHERPIFGKKSTWFPFVILVQDRTKAGVHRTLKRMNLNPSAFPVQSALEGGVMSLEAKIRAYREVNPGVRVFFVEGLHVGMEDSNDYGATSKAIRDLIALCQSKKRSRLLPPPTCPR